jgi:hypothetical protein
MEIVMTLLPLVISDLFSNPPIQSDMRGMGWSTVSTLRSRLPVALQG